MQAPIAYTESPAPPPPAVAQVAIAAAANQEQRPILQPRFDPANILALRQLAESADPAATYGNPHLAKEILQILESHDAEGIAQAMTQRIALVDQLFAMTRQDRGLARSFRPAFEKLRFTLLKSALSDSSFFTQRTHPLRLLAAELTRLAAIAYLNGGASEMRMQARLAGACDVFDLSAAFVRPTLVRLRLLPNESVQRYLHDLRDEMQERAIWRQAQARTQMAREIESRCFGDEIPDSVHRLLTEFWQPLLSKQLLAEGHDGAHLQDCLNCVDELLSALPDAAEKHLQLPGALTQKLIAGLREFGLSAEQVREIMQALQSELSARRDNEPALPQAAPSPREQALKMTPAMPVFEAPELTLPAAAQKPEAAPSPATPKDRFQLLGALLHKARWFRVFDHARAATRWLKLESYYPDQRSIAFVEFDGTNALRINAARFIEDLCEGRSAPSRASKESDQLLSQLLA